MHSTTTTMPRTGAFRVFLTLLGALLLLALGQAAPAFGAAADYTGGPAAGDYPLYVANDHSVYALRFSANGLLDSAGNPVTTSGAQYYVKIRISPTVKPSGTTNRGFIWNSASGEWVQERDDWDQFPIVTTGADGTISAGSTWTFFKFGDTTKPAADTSTTWYLLVSLKPVDGTDGTTQNNASPPTITIIDVTGDIGGATPPIAGFHVHNGVATGAAAAKRVECDASGLSDVWSISRTEPNGVDDDGDGTVDNEDFGLATSTGDFSLAVPVGSAFDAKIQGAVWPVSAASFTGATADTDIALGAADTTAPAAPATFAATAGDTVAQLSWDAVADATSYTVYKWQAATPIGGSTNYTPQHVALATVADTSYEATGLTNGETYYFEVRANDAATNVGPASSTAEVTPKAPAQLTLATTATIVNWGAAASLSGELTDGADAFTSGQQVRVEWRYTSTSDWTLLQLLDPTAPYAYGLAVRPTRKTTYRLVFTGDDTHAAATSDPVTVTPRVKLGQPTAPKVVKRGVRFTAYGSLVPRHKAGSRTVKIKCYQRKSGVWRLVKTATATNRNYSTYSRYSAKLSLGARGQWKLVASYRATSKYASKTSSARYVTVK